MAWRTHLRTVSAVPTPSRRATLIADAPMFGQRWPGKIGRKYSCRRRLWDSNCRRSCRQDSPQIEGQQIAVEHGRRLHHDLAERHGRQLDWVAPRFPHTPLHHLRHVAKMAVAGVHVRPGVDDRDHRLAGEVAVGQSVLQRARPLRERIGAVAQPALASQVVGLAGRYRASFDSLKMPRPSSSMVAWLRRRMMSAA